MPTHALPALIAQHDELRGICQRSSHRRGRLGAVSYPPHSTQSLEQEACAILFQRQGMAMLSGKPTRLRDRASQASYCLLRQSTIGHYPLPLRGLCAGAHVKRVGRPPCFEGTFDSLVLLSDGGLVQPWATLHRTISPTYILTNPSLFTLGVQHGVHAHVWASEVAHLYFLPTTRFWGGEPRFFALSPSSLLWGTRTRGSPRIVLSTYPSSHSAHIACMPTCERLA